MTSEETTHPFAPGPIPLSPQTPQQEANHPRWIKRFVYANLFLVGSLWSFVWLALPLLIQDTRSRSTEWIEIFWAISSALLILTWVIHAALLICVHSLFHNMTKTESKGIIKLWFLFITEGMLFLVLEGALYLFVNGPKEAVLTPIVLMTIPGLALQYVLYALLSGNRVAIVHCDHSNHRSLLSSISRQFSIGQMMIAMTLIACTLSLGLGIGRSALTLNDLGNEYLDFVVILCFVPVPCCGLAAWAFLADKNVLLKLFFFATVCFNLSSFFTVLVIKDFHGMSSMTDVLNLSILQIPFLVLYTLLTCAFLALRADGYRMTRVAKTNRLRTDPSFSEDEMP